MYGAHFFAGGKPIEIKIPKEIREYQESIFFGLNTRQFVCSLLALGAAVGLYFLLRDTAGTEIAGWACMLGAAPFAACGFVRYHGMTAEQLLWAVIKSELLTPHRLVFRAENVYYTVMRLSLIHILLKKDKVGEEAERKNICCICSKCQNDGKPAQERSKICSRYFED